MKAVRVQYADDALSDLDDLMRFLLQQEDPRALGLIDFVQGGLAVLTHQPGMGRPLPDGLRELILHQGQSGYLVKYRYLPQLPAARVLRVRHQRLAGYTDNEI